MTARFRLLLSGFIILLSAFYGVLVAHDPVLAQALAVGYIAIVLTAYILSNFRKKDT